MKNNTFFKLFIIFLIATLFRLSMLDKPEGLWNDEYVSWFIASKKDFGVFITEMLRNCHTPLYYIYLKIWMFFFNDTDFSLRISSVIPSLLSVITMYFLGKELKDTKTGLLTAFLTAISSFCIYFGQEVRLYSLLFLFSSLTTIYFIKTSKEPKKVNFFLFFIFNALLSATHTLGIIFSISTISLLFIFLYKNNQEYKNKLKSFLSVIKYILPFITVVVLISPFLFTIAFSNSLSQFWSDFSYTKILCCLIDYFSPILTNIVNTQDTFISYIYNGKINYIFIIFGLIPTFIALITIFNAIKQNNKPLNYFLIASLIFYIILVTLSLAGKIILITKYTSEVYPILLASLAYGFVSYKKELIKKVLCFTFIILNIFFLLTSSEAAQNRTRSEGHKAVVELLENSRLKENDYVLLTYYDVDKFEKYLSNKEKYKFYSINKFNFNYHMFNNYNYFETIRDGKIIYRYTFEEFPNKAITDYSYKNFISKMKKGERIGLIFLNTVSFLSKDNIKNILEDEKEYERTPFIFLSFSALRNSIMYTFKDQYKIDSITQAGDWTLVVFEKIN